MDGAWTGHPDQNEIAVAQFPVPNQNFIRFDTEPFPDLRPLPTGVGKHTVEGTRAAVSDHHSLSPRRAERQRSVAIRRIYGRPCNGQDLSSDDRPANETQPRRQDHGSAKRPSNIRRHSSTGYLTRSLKRSRLPCRQAPPTVNACDMPRPHRSASR